MNKNALYVLLGLLSCHSNAAPPISVCPPFASINKEISICEDNFVFSALATSCLRKYKNDIIGAKARIGKFLAEHNKRLKGKQNKTYNTADANYQSLQKELDHVINSGNAAVAALRSYQPEFFFPEDYDQPQITGMSTEQYLNSEPCFAIPRNIVEDAAKTIQGVVNDYTKTRDAAFGKEKVAESSSVNVRVAPGTTKVLKQSPSAMAPSVKGATAAGSNISETTRKAPQAPASSSPKKQQ